MISLWLKLTKPNSTTWVKQKCGKLSRMNQSWYQTESIGKHGNPKPPGLLPYQRSLWSTDVKPPAIQPLMPSFSMKLDTAVFSSRFISSRTCQPHKTRVSLSISSVFKINLRWCFPNPTKIHKKWKVFILVPDFRFTFRWIVTSTVGQGRAVLKPMNENCSSFNCSVACADHEPVSAI